MQRWFSTVRRDRGRIDLASMRLVRRCRVSLRSKVPQSAEAAADCADLLIMSSLVRHNRNSRGVAPARNRRRQLSGRRFANDGPCLWVLSLGIFDKAYAKATAGSSEEHTYRAPDLFTAETPLGTYQGMTDQVAMSRTPGSFRTVLGRAAQANPNGFQPKVIALYAYARSD